MSERMTKTRLSSVRRHAEKNGYWNNETIVELLGHIDALSASLKDGVEYARVSCLSEGMGSDGRPTRVTAQVDGGPVAVWNVKEARALLGEP